MTERASVETDIRPLSAELEIRCISKTFDLLSDEQLEAHAAGLKDRIGGVGTAIMPPPSPRRERSRWHNPPGGFL
jgi:hypothetical protein